MQSLNVAASAAILLHDLLPTLMLARRPIPA
jgi:tRNA G18 (ribose-2'-O)-methylase SpoU